MGGQWAETKRTDWENGEKDCVKRHEDDQWEKQETWFEGRKDARQRKGRVKTPCGRGGKIVVEGTEEIEAGKRRGHPLFARLCPERKKTISPQTETAWETRVRRSPKCRHRT